jgi:hypothetical protein
MTDRQRGGLLLGIALSIVLALVGAFAEVPLVTAIAAGAAVLLTVYGVALYIGWIGDSTPAAVPDLVVQPLDANPSTTLPDARRESRQISFGSTSRTERSVRQAMPTT